MPAARESSSGSGPVVEAVRRAIVSGDCVPGQRLVDADLSEQFAVSRGAVRSALIELGNEGLVEHIPNRGARMRAVSLAEAIEIPEVRMVIEALCAAEAAQRVTEAEIAEPRELRERMATAVGAGVVTTYSELNNRLHRRMPETSGPRTDEGVIERLRGQSVRHRFRLAMQPGRPSVSLPEHLGIIDAICGRDPDAAERAARHHRGSMINTLRGTGNSPPFSAS